MRPSGQVTPVNPFTHERKYKRTPPPFLKGRKISNERFTRHDAMSLAEDALVLNFTFERTEYLEPVCNAAEWVRDNSNSTNAKLGHDKGSE